jgi:hypothetical protein
MTIKECIKCNNVLPIEMFDITGKNYYRNKCKLCRLNDVKERREKIKDEIKNDIYNKICIKCNLILDISKFYKRSVNKDGYNNVCIICSKLNCNKDSTYKNDIINELYCIKCKSYKSNNEFRKTCRSNSGYYNTCKSCWKPVEWNKEKQRIAEQKYVKNNPDKIKEKNKRQSQSINKKIKNRIQKRIREAFKSHNTRKTNKTVKYIGCDIPYLKKWLEYQFNNNINWNNMHEWHIDHVIPCSEYNLLNEEDQKICFNWQNLRPCLAKDNLTKSNKIIQTLIDSHKKVVLKFLEINPLPTHPGDRDEGIE